MPIARVLFPLPLPEPFDYIVPEGFTVCAGNYVTAPIGKTQRTGVVWSIEPDSVGEGRTLKPLGEVFPVAPMSFAMRQFIEKTARYNVSHIGQVLLMALRARGGLSPSPTQTLYKTTGAPPPRLTPARDAVLTVCESLGAASATDLAQAAGVSAGVVSGLVKLGVLQGLAQPVDRPYGAPNPADIGPKLTDEQAHAAQIITAALDTQQFQPFLLDGVTGSGKTEVYFAAISHALLTHPERQILVLLPEIALTEAVFDRFEARFGTRPAPWHSGLSEPARRRSWREIANGRAKIVAGARSALYLPFQTLSLIIVDESHDTAYKQGDGVRYHARDMAVMRASLEKATIILATATPSIETKINAEQGRYGHLVLKARPGAARLPEIVLINMRDDGPERGKWLSPNLITAMRESHERGEQSLLFLNRRGYAPLVICKACGERMKSPDTDTWLTEHRYTRRLMCHLTGFSMTKPDNCPECGEADSLLGVGPGVERLAEEVRANFPDAKLVIFSSDTVRGGEAARDLVAKIAEGGVDIVIGTQMVAKGHNFPLLTCVGIIDADSGMKGGDLRAGERTYQLLSQVAGRAGRAEKRGRAFIQTYQPEDPAMQALAAGDRDGFLGHEADMRKLAGMPPFGRLAALILSAPDEEEVLAVSRAIAQAAPNGEGIRIFGPAVPPVAVIRGRHRRRFLAQSARDIDLPAYMELWTKDLKLPNRVRLTVDIDPYSFS